MDGNLVQIGVPQGQQNGQINFRPNSIMSHPAKTIRAYKPVGIKMRNRNVPRVKFTREQRISVAHQNAASLKGKAK